MSFDNLIHRWDSFIYKLQQRFYEVINQSEQPLNDVINNLQYDTVVMHNISNGLKHQAVTQLIEKAEQGWNKMESEMLSYGKVFWSQKEDQHKKLEQFREWCADEYLKFEVMTNAKAARKILENVKKHIDEKKMHRCTQCAGELPINVYSFMAVNIKCESCGSVNTYQPDDRIRALEYYVLNHLAEEYSLDIKLKAKYNKNFMKEYYKSYYGYLIQTVPDKKEFYEKQMEKRVNDPYFAMF